MTSEETTSRHHLREDGKQLHQRETRWQIWLPYGGAILLLVVAFLAVALPTDPIWRVRAEAIGDFLYTVLCLLPLWICSLGVYVAVIAGIWGMNKLHAGTERPLRKLENLAAGAANRIEKFMTIINERTMSWRAKLEQLMTFFTIFEPQDEGESQ